jgi:hypothetical protein
MKRIIFSSLSAMALFLVFVQIQPAFAQVRVNLSILDTTLSFADADPDSQPSIVGIPNPVRISVRVRNNGANNWRLTVLAAGDLSSSIPISNVTWTATGTGFVAGTMSRLVAQTAAQGTGNVNPARQGTFTFQLSNLWSYNTGIFSQTATFTLTAP